MDTGTYTRPTTGSYAYDELKSRLLRGEVALGVRLREERLAERLGVSRTPVREALLRLFAEGFLVRHPEGGYRVVPPSVQNTVDLYEVRRALELFAVARRRPDGTPAHDEAAVVALRDEWRHLGVDASAADPEFVVLDEEFHASLAEAAGNPELVDDLRRVNQRIRPVRSHDFVTPGRIATTIEQHLTIVEALLAGRRDEAADLLDRHIRESQAIVEVAAVQAMERMLRSGEEQW